MAFVCPNCLHEIRHTSDTCPTCGEVFNQNDWVKEAYDSRFLTSKISFTALNKVFRGRGISFYIGSAPGDSGIKLESPGVERKHAVVYFDSTMCAWCINGVEGAVCVDGKLSDSGEALSLNSGTQIRIGQIYLSCLIRYRLPPLSQSASMTSGKIETTELWGDEFSIGSDNRLNLYIRTASPLHAKLYKNRKTGEWWIVNCSETGTFVNGTQIHNERLYEGDSISIAGTKFIFSKTALTPFVPSGLAVDVDNVSVSKGGKEILHDIRAHIAKGEFVGVLGPSGCGKSSLIQRLVGLDTFDSGYLKVNGNDFGKVRQEVLCQTSYLPQHVALHDELTIDEESRCFCALHGIGENEIDRKLGIVGLQSEKRKKIGNLSGGQKRRFGIALGLLRNPQMLVLDEPTSGLDPSTETEVMTYLRRIASQGKTIICSTHILGNLNLFDKVLLLDAGRAVFFGTPARLISFFGVKTPYEIYKKLGRKRAVDYFSKKFEKEPKGGLSKQESITGRASCRSSGILEECKGYWKRILYEFFAFRNSSHPYAAFLQSSLFIQIIVQPLLIALAIKLSCAYKMTTATDYKEVLFFCAVSVFWLGINNAVRELVRERIPWRSLERMEQISLSGYLWAKVSWSSFVGFVQIVVFAFFIFAFPEFSTSGAGHHEVKFSIGILISLLVIGITGAWLGLAISAFFKKENAAVSLLPIVLIPVLFFSQPIIQHDAGNYSSLAASIAEAMPCYEPQMLMAKIDEHTVKPEDWAKMLGKTGLYAIFALGTMIYFQNKREREWNGR